jgi:hypothetical protein
MSLTRVTSTVLDANAVSAEKLANSSIVSRHLADAVVLLRHLSPAANTQAIVAGKLLILIYYNLILIVLRAMLILYNQM